MNTEFTFAAWISLIPLLLFAFFAFTVPRVARCERYSVVMRSHILRHALFYLVFGPPAFTYLAVCGSLSAVSSDLWSKFVTVNSPMWEHVYLLLKGIEWISSFFGALGFLWLFRWLRVSFGWNLILIASMGITAIYREAERDTVNSAGSSYWKSGPTILSEPTFIDLLPVAFGIFVFIFLFRRCSEDVLAKTSA